MLNKIFDLWKRIASHGFFVASFDFCFLFFAVYLSYAIRFTLFIPQANFVDSVKVGVVFALIVIFVFCFSKQYSTLWPQAGLEDYVRFVRAYILGAFLFVLLFSMQPFALLPRTSLVIMLFSGLIFCGTLRVSWRLVHSPHTPPARQKTLIVGAGEAGTLLARDLLRNPGELLPCGLIDDDPQKQGKRIAGLKVMGDTSSLPSLVRENGIEVVLIAIPSVNGQRTRMLYDSLASLGVSVRILPSLRELAGGNISLARLRRIRLEDLLGREPVQMEIAKVAAYLKDRRVLVTGAGGSIGSEIVRQILGNHPREIVLLGHGEQSLYLLYESLQKLSTATMVRPIVADVADITAMRNVFEHFRPEVVFHAAAHKHVPLMENNPREALRVNALGTLVVSRLAGEFGTQRMVMISTDKAVNPTSVMGATKRVAELLLGQSQLHYPATVYMAVRFGNVLGSRGSVIPKFEEQIENGGPVTVTDPAMKRYFMLIPEAVSLVLQAGAIAGGGELFVLDMGEPILIAEMAELLIRLHGYEPNKDINITFTGIRPGEKLFEELFYDPATVHPTEHPKVFASSLISKSVRAADIESLLDESLASPDRSRELLHRMVPEYRP